MRDLRIDPPTLRFSNVDSKMREIDKVGEDGSPTVARSISVKGPPSLLISASYGGQPSPDHERRLVARDGIEPPTLRFSVACSTNRSYLGPRRDFRVYRGAFLACKLTEHRRTVSDRIEGHVIYIFERDSESLRLETRYSNDSKTYEIIWRRADGTTTRESFKGETSFRTRLDEIYSDLEEKEWRTIGPPHLLADGWKI